MLNRGFIIKNSIKNKADILAACCIAIALPAYYKVKYLLEGKMNFQQLLQPAALLEVVYAFFLATLLLIFYRLSAVQLSRLNRPIARKLLPILVLIFAALIAVFFTRFFFSYVVSWGSQPSFEFDVALLAVLLPLIISGVADRVFLEGEANSAKQATLTAQFETLKSRLTPHFLFNSLNALVDIVEEDPELAVQFIEEMAAIYRYILEYRDQPLVPLKAEIESIKSLMFIYESRKPGALKMKFKLSNDGRDQQIVPMALQTILENALKHNNYSQSQPMILSIVEAKGQLVIENTLNAKKDAVSTADGLDNLNRRVNHICKQPIRIQKLANMFCVQVPLVKLDET